jgi:hypothetical protein
MGFVVRTETLHAPDAAAVMAGSAVDAMLKALGYDGGSLYSRIDKAVTEQKLTAAMGDWAHDAPRLEPSAPRRQGEAACQSGRGQAVGRIR